MSNTSATGGVLTPTNVPFDGVALRRFIHDIIAGVCDLPKDLVRPNWQPNPPVLPDASIDWCAFGIVSQRGDAYAYVKKLKRDGALLVRHERVDVLCSFYGTNCLSLAGQLRDGLEIAQNREQLFLVNMGVVGFSEISHIPELVNDRYYERADMTMTLTRAVHREYQILHFVAANGTIYADDAASQPLTRSWAVTNQKQEQ